MDRSLFDKFQDLLVQKSGILIHEDRLSLLKQKLEEKIKKLKLNSIEKYYLFLQEDARGPGELKKLIEELVVGETYFFRIEPQFQALTDYVLPLIIEQKQKKSQQQLKIWCAGCSSGDEPYTIALLLQEKFPHLKSWHIDLLATDISQKALQKATQALYSLRATHAIPPDIFSKYFLKKDKNTSQLSPEIKKKVRFLEHNLATDSFNDPCMKQTDIVFCRNVTIYFESHVLQRIINQFEHCLSPEGFLFIGPAETLWGISQAFQTIEFPQTFFYQKRSGLKITQVLPPPISLPLQEKDKKNERSRKKTPPANELIKKASHFANKGLYKEARQYLQEVISSDNLDARAYYLMGVLDTKEEHFEKAIEDFKKVLYIDPAITVVYLHLGDLYRFLKETLKAKKEYQNCLKFLQGKEDNEILSLSDGITASALKQAALRALENL